MGDIELIEGSYYLISYKDRFDSSQQKAVGEFVNQGSKQYPSYCFSFTKEGCIISIRYDEEDLKVLELKFNPNE